MDLRTCPACGLAAQVRSFPVVTDADGDVWWAAGCRGVGGGKPGGCGVMGPWGKGEAAAVELWNRLPRAPAPLEDPQLVDVRTGTLIGALACGFDGDSPVADAGAFMLARRTWRRIDLVALDHQALALSVKLCPIDRRRIGLAWYERMEIGRALLGMLDASDALADSARDIGAAGLFLMLESGVKRYDAVRASVMGPAAGGAP